MPGKAKELNRIAESGQEKAEDYWPLLNEKKCRGCGKVIFVTPDWVFKKTYGEHIEYFCKYTCKKHFEEKQIDKRRAYMRVK